MNYEAMSDEELSSELMTAIHGEQINHWCLSDCETYVYDCGPIGEQFYKVDVIDVNNPADMWPLITENSISLFALDDHDEEAGEYTRNGLWQAMCVISDEGSHYDRSEWLDAKCDNPLRAAAIVFLMMREAEK